MLSVNDLKPEELALSDTAGESGNNVNLLALLDLKGQSITLSGSQVTLNDAFAGLLGKVASASRQNQADQKTATTVASQAQAQRDSVSAVSLDEEAVNLITYQQAYQVALTRCSTEVAPWYVVPADRKWYARWAVQQLLLAHLRALDPQWPPATFDVEAEQTRLAAS